MLKNSLTEELSTKANRQIKFIRFHSLFSSLKTKYDETCQEYIYRILEIASHADIELEAKIQYIIDGLQHNEASKSILYGATAIK